MSYGLLGECCHVDARSCCWLSQCDPHAVALPTFLVQWPLPTFHCSTHECLPLSLNILLYFHHAVCGGHYLHSIGRCFLCAGVLLCLLVLLDRFGQQEKVRFSVVSLEREILVTVRVWLEVSCK